MSSEFGERLEMAQDAFNDLLQERDTLIIALRGCVVALEGGWAGIWDAHYGNGISKEYAQAVSCEMTKAITNAKSTLERYKGDK